MWPVLGSLRTGLSTVLSLVGRVLVGAWNVLRALTVGSRQITLKVGGDEEVLWDYRGMSPTRVLSIAGSAAGMLYLGLMYLDLQFELGGPGVHPPLYLGVPLVFFSFFAVVRNGFVEVAVTERAIRRHTGFTMLHVPTWAFVPHEEIVTVTPTTGSESEPAHRKSGVRVVTDDGEDYFFRTGLDEEGFVAAVAERAGEDVVATASGGDADASRTTDRPVSGTTGAAARSSAAASGDGGDEDADPTEESPTDLARGHLSDLVESGRIDAERTTDLFVPHVDEDARTVAEQESAFLSFRAATTDPDLEILGTNSDEDSVTVRYVLTGGASDADGDGDRYPGTVVFDVEDDRLAASWHVVDAPGVTD